VHASYVYGKAKKDTIKKKGGW